MDIAQNTSPTISSGADYASLPKGAHVNFNTSKPTPKGYKLLRQAQARPEAPRTKVRGVRHFTPVRTYIGAWVAIFTIVSCIASIVITPFLLLFNAHAIYILITPAVLIFCFPLFLIFSMRSKCSVCKHKIFSLRRFTHHKKAHRINGLGYIIPTAMHSILFLWVRCPACGTAQRLIGNTSKKQIHDSFMPIKD